MINQVVAATFSIGNLDLIYNNEYSFSLPRNVLETYIFGTAFENKEAYTLDEIKKTEADTTDLFHKMVFTDPSHGKVAVLTAGAPGAGKTVKMEQELEFYAKQGRKYPYVDPDAVALKSGMPRTYSVEVANGDGSPEARSRAYHKWRSASNAVTQLILAHLIKQNSSFYYGTTSTAPKTGIFLNFLKTRGYKIKFIHITASDEVRYESIKERDKTFIQTTEKDIKGKGVDLPQRIKDTYLAFADEILFCYRDGVKSDAKLCAKWLRNTKPADHLGTLLITDQEGYSNIKQYHNAACQALNKPELLWESTVEKESECYQARAL